ncbi:MAG: oxidoreductase domain protein [Mucilaginibacter sp.]|nr:oxidoreductase domain protein [Mucilaginibacter sp.]
MALNAKEGQQMVDACKKANVKFYAINGPRYMTGEEPVWVTAQETKTDPLKFKEGVDETINFNLAFPAGR